MGADDKAWFYKYDKAWLYDTEAEGCSTWSVVSPAWLEDHKAEVTRFEVYPVTRFLGEYQNYTVKLCAYLGRYTYTRNFPNGLAALAWLHDQSNRTFKGVPLWYINHETKVD